MEQLDDRLTAFSNQQKCSDEAYADSLSEMHDNIGILKTDMDKKFDSVKITNYTGKNKGGPRPGQPILKTNSK